MKKILISVSIIGAVAAIAIGATTAYFSDTETSAGNTFTAGSLDLKISNHCYYNGMECALAPDGTYHWNGNVNDPLCNCSWASTDFATRGFFDFADLKPGDNGEDTIRLYVDNNDAWLCMTITPKKNDDISSTEPELGAGDVQDVPTDLWDGELAQALTGKIWADVCTTTPAYPGDNIYQADCDNLIGDGIISPFPTTGAVTWPLADANRNAFTRVAGQPLTGLQNYYIGVSWNLPGETGNIVQSDSYVSDISFYTEQARNNSGFDCFTPRP